MQCQNSETGGQSKVRLNSRWSVLAQLEFWEETLKAKIRLYTGTSQSHDLGVLTIEICVSHGSPRMNRKGVMNHYPQ